MDFKQPFTNFLFEIREFNVCKPPSFQFNFSRVFCFLSISPIFLGNMSASCDQFNYTTDKSIACYTFKMCNALQENKCLTHNYKVTVRFN